VEFVPPNDTVGGVYSTNQNDNWATGRGIVFQADQHLTLDSIGVFQDLTSINLNYSFSQIDDPFFDVTAGQIILSAGTLSNVTTSGLQWIDVAISPLTLTAGNYYHLLFDFLGNSNQNFFYINQNVSWTQDAFSLLEGTQGGNTDNSVVAAFRVNVEQVPGPMPIFGVAAAYGFSRNLRKRIKASKSFEFIC
jgi:hypothetical protein